MMTPMEVERVRALFARPLLDLVFEAAGVHRRHHPPHEMQRCTLLSIKTGACPEDCAYCAQSARYTTQIEREPLMERAAVKAEAEAAAAAGATGFCLGAGWRENKAGPDFDRVLGMVGDVAATGMEVCCTLGMLTSDQAHRLKEAGLTAYNHNLDTSERYYKEIITTRTYQDRIDTIQRVAEAGIAVCCGGIIGMGETREDRIELLAAIAGLDPQPESVPINVLVPIEGTPLMETPPLDPFEVVRAIAVARILMPRSRVRLAAGRLELTDEAQALCFLAGANSIFFGERLLTTPNPDLDRDQNLLEKLGMRVTDEVGTGA